MDVSLWNYSLYFGRSKTKYALSPKLSARVVPTLFVSLSLCLLCRASHPGTSFTLQRESKASVYYEVPKALCRVVLSNNNQWRQRLSAWAGKEWEGGGGDKGIKRTGRRGRQTWKAAVCEKSILVCQLPFFYLHVSAVQHCAVNIFLITSFKHWCDLCSSSLKTLLPWICPCILSPFSLWFRKKKRKRSVMLRHTSAAERNSVYGPITGACMFML